MLKIRKILLIGCLVSCAALAVQAAVNKSNSAQFSKKLAVAKKTTSEAMGIKNSAKTISFADNEQISVVLSKVDINQITVQRDKILSLNGPTGLYTARNDPNGAAYITLYADMPFTLYVTTVSGHSLSLFVVPVATVGKTIVLIPTSLPKAADTQEEDSSYQKTLITLMSAMLTKTALDDYSYSEIKKGKSQSFLGLAKLTPIAIYNGAALDGIIYKIKNKTSQPLTLNPASFYQKDVRAVALSSQTIVPNGTGLLYEIVSKG